MRPAPLVALGCGVCRLPSAVCPGVRWHHARPTSQHACPGAAGPGEPAWSPPVRGHGRAAGAAELLPTGGLAEWVALRAQRARRTGRRALIRGAPLREPAQDVQEWRLPSGWREGKAAHFDARAAPIAAYGPLYACVCASWATEGRVGRCVPACAGRRLACLRRAQVARLGLSEGRRQSTVSSPRRHTASQLSLSLVVPDRGPSPAVLHELCIQTTGAARAAPWSTPPSFLQQD